MRNHPNSTAATMRTYCDVPRYTGVKIGKYGGGGGGDDCPVINLSFLKGRSGLAPIWGGRQPGDIQSVNKHLCNVGISKGQLPVGITRYILS